MKLSFSKIEDKFIFNISRYFWHIIIGLVTLGIVVSACFIIWGIIPASKNDATKDNYPPVEKVKVNEIAQLVDAEKPVKNNNSIVQLKKHSKKAKSHNELKPTVNKVLFDSDMAVNKLYDSLQILIPPKKYSWSAIGYWEFPYGYYFQYNKRWKETSPSIEYSIKNAFNSLNLSSPDKAELLSMYINNVKQFSENNRMNIFRNLIKYSKVSFDETKKTLNLLADAIKIYSPSKTDYLYYYDRLLEQDNEAYSLLSYTNNFVGKFNFDNRDKIAWIILYEYLNRYKSRINEFKDISDGFVPLMKSIVEADQPKYLKIYFNLGYSKNEKRAASIRSIDEKYTSDLLSAESNYEESKIKKAGFRLQGIYGIGAGVVAIAFLALLLVLLSIQRYIKKMYDRTNPPLEELKRRVMEDNLS